MKKPKPEDGFWVAIIAQGKKEIPRPPVYTAVAR
jgi:hypothetical protein